ncbi:MAG: hypothetical protein IJ010_06815 [Ruminococcus sp.]|nr:hypothetical protein [Ruminococcus sp.]
MNIIEKVKKNLAKGAKNNLSLAIYSVIIACIAWFVISMALYPSVTKQIRNIEVSLDISGTSASENGLSVISCNLEEVNVTVKGSRTQASKMNSNSFIAYIDTSGVTAPGRRTLPLKIRSKDNIPFEVESITPSTVVVNLDKYETIEIPVEPKCPNISTIKGKVIYQAEHKCNPSTVKITGPSVQLDKISKCYAYSDKSMDLESSIDITTDKLQLLADDGTIIDQSMMEFSNSSFSINIPVLTQKTVKLSVQIIGGSADFDKSSMKFDLSADSLTVASRNSQLEIPDPLDIGKINLSDVGLGYTKSFDINALLETSNVINMSGLETVVLTLDDTDLEKKEFILDKSSIHISNKPGGGDYDYDLISQNVKICVVGPKEEIAKLTPADFAAEANLLNTDIPVGQSYFDVTVHCLASDKVWAIANPSKPTVLIQKSIHIEPEEDEELIKSDENSSQPTTERR